MACVYEPYSVKTLRNKNTEKEEYSSVEILLILTPENGAGPGNGGAKMATETCSLCIIAEYYSKEGLFLK